MSTNGNDARGTVFMYVLDKDAPGHMTCEEIEVLDSIGDSCTVMLPRKGDIPIGVVPGKVYPSYDGPYVVLKSRNDDDARLTFVKYCRTMVTHLEKEIRMYLDAAVVMMKRFGYRSEGDI